MQIWIVWERQYKYLEIMKTLRLYLYMLWHSLLCVFTATLWRLRSWRKFQDFKQIKGYDAIPLIHINRLSKNVLEQSQFSSALSIIYKISFFRNIVCFKQIISILLIVLERRTCVPPFHDTVNMIICLTTQRFERYRLFIRNFVCYLKSCLYGTFCAILRAL